MSIGICDADFLHYPNSIFNLDAMKLWPYYSKRGKIISLMDDFVFDKYSQIVYLQDYPSDFPPLLSQYNVYFRGRAISQNQYIPLAEDIERTLPNTQIYDRIFRVVFPNQESAMQKLMLGAVHTRISLDGKSVWGYLPQYVEAQGRAPVILFHDYYPNRVMNGLAAIKEASDIVFRKKPQGIYYIGFKFPVEIEEFDDLIAWLEFPYEYTAETHLQYRGGFTGAQLERLARCNPMRTRRLDYVVTGNSSDENDFMKNHLREILMQTKYFREHHLKISLMCEDDFFLDKRGENLSYVLNYFMNDERPAASFFEACRDARDNKLGAAARKRTERLREAFYYVNECSDCVEDLYCTDSVTLKGGKLEYE